MIKLPVLNKALKSLLAIFLFGICLGITLSPLTETKPQHILNKPVPLIQARQDLEYRENVAVNGSVYQNGYIAKLLAMFDAEQMQLQALRPKISSSQSAFGQILGTQTDNSPVTLREGSATLAFIGDSMTDTMETGLPYLQKTLKTYYPRYHFTLLNYGIGGENAVKAAERINQPYGYKDRSYPELIHSNADIIIIESFAYNPLENTTEGFQKHTTALTAIINAAKQTDAQILFLATQAPIKTGFGEGPGGVNWDANQAWNHATIIQSYMENAIRVAKEQNVPVIDIYHATLQPNGEGIRTYVSSHDGIHPSETGQVFIADSIASYIAKNNVVALSE